VEERAVSAEDGSRVAQGEHRQPGDDPVDRVHPVGELGDDAEVAAPTPQRPEEVGLVVGIGDDPTAVGEDNFRGEEVVQGQAESPGQRAVASAQGETGHADGPDRAGDWREAEGRLA